MFLVCQKSIEMHHSLHGEYFIFYAFLSLAARKKAWKDKDRAAAAAMANNFFQGPFDPLDVYSYRYELHHLVYKQSFQVSTSSLDCLWS